MTKPVTAVTLLMLHGQALVHLDDPVDVFMPEFRDLRLLIPGATALDQTVPVRTRPTSHHLLTHTAGLSLFTGPGLPAEADARETLGLALNYGGLDRMVRHIAELPLELEPGTRWQQGAGLDVIGRVVEVVSGQSLDRFFATRIFAPLGMTDTALAVPDASLSRFCPMCQAAPGGLVGTIVDYRRFFDMLRSVAALGGERLLGAGMLRLAAGNHLPGDLAVMATEVWAETQFDGVGFGLPGSVVLDQAKAGSSARVGDCGWGGAAGTFFRVSPVDDMVVILFTQLLPSSAIPVRKELRAPVTAALTGA
jgi:CubicO group peptidase (beta-lactamase class C family)